MKDRSFSCFIYSDPKNASWSLVGSLSSILIPALFTLSSLIAHNIYPGPLQRSTFRTAHLVVVFRFLPSPLVKALFPDNPLLPLHTHPFLSIHHLSHLPTILRTHTQNNRPP